MDMITAVRLAVVIPYSFQRGEETWQNFTFLKNKLVLRSDRERHIWWKHMETATFRLSTLSAVWLTKQQRDTDGSFGAEAAASPCDTGSAAPSNPTKPHFIHVKCLLMRRGRGGAEVADGFEMETASVAATVKPIS